MYILASLLHGTALYTVLGALTFPEVFEPGHQSHVSVTLDSPNIFVSRGYGIQSTSLASQIGSNVKQP